MASRRTTVSLAALLLFAATTGGCAALGSALTFIADLDPCPEMSLSARHALPLDAVALRGAPERFPDKVVVEAEAGGATSYSVGERIDGDLLLYLPPHPASPMTGGSVSVRILAADRACPIAESFQIGPLEPAPGTHARLLEGLEAVLSRQAAALEVSRAEVVDADLASLDPKSLAVRLAQDLFDARLAGAGPGVEAGPTPDTMVSEEGWEVYEALLARSSLVDLAAELATALDGALRLAPPATRAADAPLNTSSSNNPAYCSAVLPFHNATLLDAAMRLAVLSHVYNRNSRWDIVKLEAATFALAAFGRFASATAVAGPAGKVQRGVGAGYSLAANVIAAARAMIQLADGVLPNRLIAMTFDVAPDTFDEDDPVHGTWHTVEVVAANDGVDLSEELISTVGSAMIGRLGKHVAPHLGHSPRADAFDTLLGAVMSTEHLRAIADSVAGFIGGGLFARAGDVSPGHIARFPPCTFGPVDVSDARWTEARFLEGPARLTTHGAFEVTGVGRAVLEVAIREGRLPFSRGFEGANVRSATRDVTIRPIEVRFEPTRRLVAPGGRAVFEVVVDNARDPRVEVTADAGAVEVVSHADGRHTVTYTAPEEPAPPRAELRARSLATGGLRAHHAPERSARATAVIRPDGKVCDVDLAALWDDLPSGEHNLRVAMCGPPLLGTPWIMLGRASLADHPEHPRITFTANHGASPEEARAIRGDGVESLGVVTQGFIGLSGPVVPGAEFERPPDIGPGAPGAFNVLWPDGGIQESLIENCGPPRPYAGRACNFRNVWINRLRQVGGVVRILSSSTSCEIEGEFELHVEGVPQGARDIYDFHVAGAFVIPVPPEVCAPDGGADRE